MPKLKLRKLPAHGSILCGHCRFFVLNIPQPPTGRVQLVETPVHDGPAPSKVLSVDPEKLRVAISLGVVTLLPKLRSAPAGADAAPGRPYPFEAARDAARKRRMRLWRLRKVMELRRRGLLMTGAEYARRLEATSRPELPSDHRDLDD